MAANNETGVVSDLAGIEAALEASGSAAFWMVDGVQALGKIPLRLSQSRIDYAPFSGHKLYAPKGIGLLYVRNGAPFTPLMAGGGQEGALRSGTENMSGIAALGAVLEALEDPEGKTFRSHAEMSGFRARLAAALEQAFPGLVYNAPLAQSLPTTPQFLSAGPELAPAAGPVRRRRCARQRRFGLQRGQGCAELCAPGHGLARLASRRRRAPVHRPGRGRGFHRRSLCPHPGLRRIAAPQLHEPD